MILCLADDLTGLAEIAAATAEVGICGLLYPVPDSFPTTPRSERQTVVFLNLACRAMAGAQARDRIAAVVRHFSRHGAPRIYLKIDSAARGPIGWLIQGLIDCLHPAQLPVVLSNPSTGRATTRGEQWIGDRRLHESAFRDDPLHPARESYLPRLLSSGLGAPIGLGDRSPALSPPGVNILDARTAEDIEHLAEAWRNVPVAAGAAPFGVRLIRRWCRPSESPAPAFEPFPFSGLLAVVGSRHPAAQALIAEFHSAGGRVMTPGEASGMTRLPLLIRPPLDPGDPQSMLHDLIDVTEKLIRRLAPGGLLIVGGETAQALLQKLKLNCLRPVGQRAGVAELLAESPPAGGRPRRLFLSPGSYHQAGLIDRLFPPQSL